MMVWTVVVTAALIAVAIASLTVLDAVDAMSTGLFGWLFARGIAQFAESMENDVSNDPIYKKNLQRLIERNREFEETKNEPRS
jgi:hypothetical protein